MLEEDAISPTFLAPQYSEKPYPDTRLHRTWCFP